ncbi:phage tail protein [Pseudomonas asiatica]|uniref:phage tail-collar fiber domain-containing protein n=1 Tax=Pseudomonas TaxID=286 RepID=UPI002E7C02F0|nr:phage tail protein [Pseudomonas asiatica]MEE1917542.1 phage tail protein [Pseudomonas asiatica]
MSTPLQPVFTKAGLAAILRADNTGIAAQITHIALGTSGYTPSADQKSLVAQTAKYPIAGGERLSSTLLHLTALADGDSAFWVREIGFLLSDGTLLAVWSDPSQPLTYKSADTDLLLAYDLSLSALPADSVTIVSNEAGLSLSLAGPLAAQAQALIAEQLRGLQQQDQLDQQSQWQRVAGEQISRLLSRMSEVERRQDADRENLSSAVVGNAAAVVADQLLGLQRQEQLDALADASRRSGVVLDNHTQRLQAAELRQDIDRENLLSVSVSNAAAVIALQTLVSKNTFGA